MIADVELRRLETFDMVRIRGFFESLGEGDRTFVRAAVLRPGVIESWIDNAGTARDRRYLAVVDGEIVGYLAVLPDIDWSAHVAAVRIVVHPAHRRRGIATTLARHAVVIAARDGIRKLVVEVLAHEDATIAMFTGLGFEAEGLLREHVISTAGQSYDVLVLAHFVDQLYETMATVGMSEGVTR